MAAMQMSFFLVFCFLCLLSITNGATPSGCTYDATGASVGIYSCDWTSITKPIAMTGFTLPDPQRMNYYKVSGTISANTFSSFSSYVTANLDSNYAASLEIECTAGGSLTLVAGSFAGLSYIQTVKIINCAIASIPTNVFSDFTALDYFLIEGGSIAGLDTATLTGLNVSKTLYIPDPKGEFAIKNSAITGGFPANFFDPIIEVKTITLDNVGITDITDTTFALNTAVTTINLPNNGITNISSTAFTGLNALSYVDLSGLSWDCTCDSLWFITDFATKGIETKGGVICATPTSHTNKRGYAYYGETCITTDVCGSTPGVAVGDECLSVYQIASFAVLFVALVLSCIALGLVCYTRKQLTENKNKLKSKKNTSWTKVQDALKRGGGAGQKPPSNTAPPKGKGWV